MLYSEINSKFLVLLTEEGEIDEDEVLCLREMMKRDGYLTNRRKRFDLSKIPSGDCSLDFRFNRSQLEILCEVLHFPQYFLTDEEHTQREIPAMEGLYIQIACTIWKKNSAEMPRGFLVSSTWCWIIVTTTFATVSKP